MYKIDKKVWGKLNSFIGDQVAYNGKRYVVKDWQYDKENGFLFYCIATWWEDAAICFTPTVKQDKRFFDLQTIISGKL